MNEQKIGHRLQSEGSSSNQQSAKQQAWPNLVQRLMGTFAETTPGKLDRL